MPVCCPQFGNMGPFQAQHGFVRNSQFSVKAASPTSATLQLVPTDDQLQGQIGAFTVQVTVSACLCTLYWEVAGSAEHRLRSCELHVPCSAYLCLTA